MLVDLAALFDPTDGSPRDACAVRNRPLRVATVATVQNYECGLEVVVRREVALWSDVEAKGWSAGLLAEQFGLRWPFLAFALSVGVAFVLVFAMVPQPDVAHTDHLTVRSALGNYAELLGRKNVAAATVVLLVMFLSNSMYIAFLPTWLEASLGVTGGAIAGIFFSGGIASVLAGPRAGQLSDHVGRKPLIIGASLGIAVLILLTSVVAANIWAVYVLFFFVMVLFASRGTPFQTLMTEMVSGDRRGSFLSLTVGIGQFGNGLGGAAAGAAYATVGYPATTVIGEASMVLIAVLVWRFLPDTVSTNEPTIVSEARSSIGALGTV